jgi:hypothetical protein
VTVISTVTEITPGSEYLYTYQVTDIDQFISLLAIPFPVSLTKPTEIYDFSMSGPMAIYWGTLNNPAIAAHAFFSPDSVVNGTSAEFSFKSIHAAQVVQGYVNDAQLGSLYGDLLAPVPEPLTLSFLAMGAGVLMRKKHKSDNVKSK